MITSEGRIQTSCSLMYANVGVRDTVAVLLQKFKQLQEVGRMSVENTFLMVRFSQFAGVFVGCIQILNVFT